MSHTTICLCYLLRLLARAGARFALPALEEPAFDEPARFAIWAAWLVASAATPATQTLTLLTRSMTSNSNPGLNPDPDPNPTHKEHGT